MRVFVAEWRKVVTTRLWWRTLIAIFVLSAGWAVLPATVGVPAGSGPAAFADPGIVRSIYHGGNPLARTLALVVGIVAVSGEHRYGTLIGTYLATPRRGRVLLAKAATLFVLGLLFGLASVVAGLLVAVPFVLRNSGSFGLADPAMGRSLVLGVVSIALWTLIGMGIGTLVRSLVLALLVGIGFAFLLEPFLAYLFYRRGWDQALNVLPSGATNAMLGVSSPILFPSAQPVVWWLGLAVLAAWCVIPALVGALVTRFRDIS